MEPSEAILVVQTLKGVDALMARTVKLGADASAALGGRGGGMEGSTYYGSVVKPSDILQVRKVSANPHSKKLYEAVSTATGVH